VVPLLIILASGSRSDAIERCIGGVSGSTSAGSTVRGVTIAILTAGIRAGIMARIMARFLARIKVGNKARNIVSNDVRDGPRSDGNWIPPTATAGIVDTVILILRRLSRGSSESEGAERERDDGLYKPHFVRNISQGVEEWRDGTVERGKEALLYTSPV